MKALLSLSCALLISFISLDLYSQVSINNDATPPDPSAMLDVQSDSLGVLIPKMTEVQKDAIINPANGLLIYQTDITPGFYFFNGSDWRLIGAEAFSINDLSDGRTAGFSVFIGSNSGLNDDGSNNNNVGLGFEALKSNTNGDANTAIGKNAMSNNTLGSGNTAIGNGALAANIGGFENVAIGSVALDHNTYGWNNIALGFMALRNNLTADHNVSIGMRSSFYNTTGEHNVAVGL